MQLMPLPLDNPLGLTIQIFFEPQDSNNGKCFDNFSNIPLISVIPAHLGNSCFVSPSSTSPTNLSIEHSVSASPTKIELD